MQSSGVVKVAIIAGVRPEIIKLAPVIKAVQAHTGMQALVIHTGQHRQLGAEAWSWFGVTPTYDLDVMEENQPLDVLTGRMMQLLSPVLSSEKPDCVIVQGDTSSALAGALSAFLHKIPVAHVEAGLRTHHKYSPFPEEMNRALISQLAQWHFAPTPQAQQNLLDEGIANNYIWMTGNTIVDSLKQFVLSYTSNQASVFFQKKPRLVLVTMHRRENQNEKLFQLIDALKIMASRTDVVIRVIMHPAPFLQQNLYPLLQNQPNIECVAPAPYPLFLQWIQEAFLLITDSGGIQEEAATLGKPLVLVRPTTERTEALYSGNVIRVDMLVAEILEEITRLFNDENYYLQRCKTSDIYGQGNAAQQIINILYPLLAQPS